MEYKIVMISGQQGSGKSTISKSLIDWHAARGKTAVTVKFADVLYRMHDAILEILNEYIEPRDIVKDGPLLQLLGTEWGRKNIRENLWVEILQERIRLMSVKTDIKDANGYKYPDLYIIDDCRFENEFNAFPESLRVRLHAPEIVRKERCSMWRENTFHPSETGLNNYDALGKFDLYLNTEKLPVSSCVNLILAQLDKNNWVQKRDWL